MQRATQKKNHGKYFRSTLYPMPYFYDASKKIISGINRVLLIGLEELTLDYESFKIS
jgi:hypothetical protein